MFDETNILRPDVYNGVDGATAGITHEGLVSLVA